MILKSFFNYFKKIYDLQCVYYYEGIITKQVFLHKNKDRTLDNFINEKNAKLDFFRLLKSFGYIVVQKPVHEFYDNSIGEYKRKCNFDVELTLNAIENIDRYDVFILVSGDGDFVKLLKYLKGKHKKVIVVSDKKRLNWQLKNTANQIIYFDFIKDKITHEK